jgi:hypothetical protein
MQTRKLIATAVTAAVLGSLGVSVAGAVDGGDGSGTPKPAATETSAHRAHRAPEGVRHPGRHAHRHRHPVRRAALRITAETIGIDVYELVEALRAGQTVAEVAEANGTDPQEVVDALTAAAAERIDRFVYGPDDDER